MPVLCPRLRWLRPAWVCGLGAFFGALTVAHTEPAVSPAAPRALGLSHVAVKAAGYEKSVAFYRDFLGFAEQGRLFDPKNGRPLLVFLKINDLQTIEVFDAANVSQAGENLYQIALQIEDAEAIRRRLQRHGYRVPPAVPLGQMRNANFTVREPSGQIVEFVQYLPEGRIMLDRGKFLSPARISDRLVAAGVVAGKPAETGRFFGEILGLPAESRGAGGLTFQVGTRGDRIEVVAAAPDGAPFFRFAVPDLNRALAVLARSPHRASHPRAIAIESGLSPGRVIRLVDPDGVRVELVER